MEEIRKAIYEKIQSSQYLTIWPCSVLPPGVRSIWNIALAPGHGVRSSYDKYERNQSSALGGDTITNNVWLFDLWPCPTQPPGVGSKWNFALAPRHGVRSSYNKYERNRSSGLGGDRITSLKTDRQTDGGDSNIPNFFLKSGDNK